MKVLLTTDWYAPAVNGVVTSVLNLRKELTAAGHEVKVLTLAPGGGKGYVEDGVTYLPSFDGSKVYPEAIIRHPRYKKYLDELISWNPDIVHSQCEVSTYAPAKYIAKVCHAPLAHTYHTVYEYYVKYLCPIQPVNKKVAAIFSAKTVNKADVVIAPSAKIEKLLLEYGVKIPIEIIPTGIDVERFKEEPDPDWIKAKKEELGIPADATILLSIGRLAQEKNLGEIVRYLYNMPRKDIYFLVVGQGPYRKTMDKLVRKFNLQNRVIFTGQVDPKEVNRYYHLGDLFVNASVSETQGLTYIEALSAGVPLLCRKDSCLDGIVDDGINGWQYESEKDFDKCLNQYCDDCELRAKIKANVKENCTRFSTKNFAKRVEAVYRKLLEEKDGL